MQNKRRFVVFAIFILCLFFLMTFAGGANNKAIATRTVEFVDGFDNSTISLQKVEVGKNAEVPEDPKHKNYVFAGWFLYEDHDTKVTNFKKIVKDLKVIALYAGDKNNNGIADEDDNYYTVKFIDTITSAVIDSQKVLEGLDASAPTAPKHDGYVFTGWSRGYTNVQSNITVNALYKDIEDEVEIYEVTFIDGDTDEVIEIQEVEKGLAATLPEAPAHEDRVFDHWEGEYEKISADTTITAIYKDDKNNDEIADDMQAHYTVTYKDYDETTIKVFEDVLVDTETPTIKNPTREYYEFEGWKPEVAETVTDNAVYVATYKPENDSDNDGKADEEEKKFTVIYKLEETDESAYAKYENQVDGIKTPVPEDPDKEYAVFGGWEPEVAEKVTSDATYIAKWLEDKDNDNKADKEEKKFTVIYKLEETDESEYAKYENQVDGIKTPVPEDPDKEYAVFGGWEPEVAEKVTEDATYTATWKDDQNGDGIADEDQDKFTITYMIDKDTEYEIFEDVLVGLATPTPEKDPKLTGYVFAGWDKEIAEKVTSDATYTATWKDDKNGDGIADEDQDKFTITYMIDKDTEYEIFEDVLVGLETPTPEKDPKLTGYVFAGWDKEISEKVTSDATYTATWKDDKNNDGIADEDQSHYDVKYMINDTLVYKEYNDILTGLETPIPEEEPSLRDYVFAGWDKEIAETVTEDATYTATWKDDKNNDGIADEDQAHYDIKYMIDTNLVYEEYNDVLTGLATPIPEKNPSLTGYVFAGWDKEIAETVTKDATYTATWKDDKNNDGIADEDQERYDVKYMIDRTLVYEEYSDILTGLETPVPEKDPSLKGYVFAGWDKEIAEKVTEDATYTATWKDDKNNDGKADEDQEKYTITYMIDKDTEYEVFENILIGLETPTPEEDPSLRGYVFAGWDKEIAEKVTEDATYTATWKDDKNNDGIADEDQEKYTITYMIDKDTEYEVFENVLIGLETPTPEEDPSLRGYVFAGWDKEIAEKVTEDATYTATWKDDKNNDGIADEDQEKYTITYMIDKDTEYEVFENVLVGLETPTPEKDPSLRDYIFAGWDKEIAKTVTEDATYTATWKDDKNNDGIADEDQILHTVRFYGFDNKTVINTQLVVDKEAAVAPSAPTVDGYRFEKWLQDFSSVTKDLDVYAQYKDVKAPNITANPILYETLIAADITITATDNVGVKTVKYLAGDHSIEKYNSAANLTANANGTYTISNITENGIYTIFAEDVNGNISLKKVEVEGIIVLEGNFEDLYATGSFGSLDGFVYWWRTLSISTKPGVKIVDARAKVNKWYNGTGYGFATEEQFQDPNFGDKIKISDDKTSLSYTASGIEGAAVAVYVTYEYKEEIAPGQYATRTISKLYKSRLALFLS